MSALSCHETADLRQQHVERRGAQQRGLTAHVGAGNHHYLRGLRIEDHGVGDIGSADWKFFLDYRVTPLADVDYQRVVDHRAVVAVLKRHTRQALQAVEGGNQVGIGLDGRHVVRERSHKRVVDGRLEYFDAFLCVEYLFLVFLELLGDVALGVYERLLAYPVGWHLVAVRVGHLYVVAVHVVVADFQACDARSLALAALNAHQVVLPLVGHLAQLVEFGVNPLAYHVAAVKLVGGVVHDFLLDAAADGRAWIKLLAEGAQGGAVGLFEHQLHRLDGAQSVAHLHHLARCDAQRGHFGNQPFQVADAPEVLHYGVAHIGVPEKVFYGVEARVDFRGILERKRNPAAQHARPHGADGAVDHVEQ